MQTAQKNYTICEITEKDTEIEDKIQQSVKRSNIRIVTME
jgi:hypothetical protein